MGLTPEEMQKAVISNLPTKTGKNLQQWIKILKESGVEKKKAQLVFLKELGLGHVQANIVIQRSNNEDSTEYDNKETLINNIFEKQPEEMRVLYEKITAKLKELDKDIDLRPCKTYLPYYKKTQFLILKPNKTEMRVALALKEKPEGNMFTETKNLGSAKINYEFKISKIEELTPELLDIVKKALKNN